MTRRHLILAVLGTCISLGVVVDDAAAFVQQMQIARTTRGHTCTKEDSSLPSKRKSTLFAEQKMETNSMLRRLGPSVFFLALAAMLGKFVTAMLKSPFTFATIGTVSLFCATLATGYDNVIIGLGCCFAGNSLNILKWLSYPRFFLHFIGVPFLYTTTAEIGKAVGVSWLQSNWIQTTIALAATFVALTSTRHFLQSPGIVLLDANCYPPTSLARQVPSFTYAKQDFCYYVLPSIVLAVFNLIVGVSCSRPAARFCLVASAVSVLIGSAPKKHVARFTGNFAEVSMLWCMYESLFQVVVVI